MRTQHISATSGLLIGALMLFYGAANGRPPASEGHEHGGGGHEHGGGEESRQQVTVVGEVIDYVCYIGHGSRGPEHKKCAEYCANQGITLGILDEKTDEILLSFPLGHDNPNTPLMDYIAQRVKVTGNIYEKGGLKGIEIKKVEALGRN